MSNAGVRWAAAQCLSGGYISVGAELAAAAVAFIQPDTELLIHKVLAGDDGAVIESPLLSHVRALPLWVTLMDEIATVADSARRCSAESVLLTTALFFEFAGRKQTSQSEGDDAAIALSCLRKRVEGLIERWSKGDIQFDARWYDDGRFALECSAALASLLYDSTPNLDRIYGVLDRLGTLLWLSFKCAFGPQLAAELTGEWSERENQNQDQIAGMAWKACSNMAALLQRDADPSVTCPPTDAELLPPVFTWVRRFTPTLALRQLLVGLTQHIVLHLQQLDVTGIRVHPVSSFGDLMREAIAIADASGPPDDAVACAAVAELSTTRIRGFFLPCTSVVGSVTSELISLHVTLLKTRSDLHRVDQTLLALKPELSLSIALAPSARTDVSDQTKSQPQSHPDVKMDAEEPPNTFRSRESCKQTKKTNKRKMPSAENTTTMTDSGPTRVPFGSLVEMPQKKTNKRPTDDDSDDADADDSDKDSTYHPSPSSSDSDRGKTSRHAKRSKKVHNQEARSAASVASAAVPGELDVLGRTSLWSAHSKTRFRDWDEFFDGSEVAQRLQSDPAWRNVAPLPGQKHAPIGAVWGISDCLSHHLHLDGTECAATNDTSAFVLRPSVQSTLDEAYGAMMRLAPIATYEQLFVVPDLRDYFFQVWRHYMLQSRKAVTSRSSAFALYALAYCADSPDERDHADFHKFAFVMDLFVNDRVLPAADDIRFPGLVFSQLHPVGEAEILDGAGCLSSLMSWWVSSQRLDSDPMDDPAAMSRSDRYSLDAICAATGRNRWIEILYMSFLATSLLFYPILRKHSELTVFTLLRITLTSDVHTSTIHAIRNMHESLGLTQRGTTDTAPLVGGTRRRTATAAAAAAAAATTEGKSAGRRAACTVPHELYGIARGEGRLLADRVRRSLARLVGSNLNQTSVSRFFRGVAQLLSSRPSTTTTTTSHSLKTEERATFFEFAETMAAAIQSLRPAAHKDTDRVVVDVTRTRASQLKLHFLGGSFGFHTGAPDTLDPCIRALMNTAMWRHALQLISRVAAQQQHAASDDAKITEEAKGDTKTNTNTETMATTNANGVSSSMHMPPSFDFVGPLGSSVVG